MRVLTGVLAVTLVATTAIAKEHPTPEQVVERSIAYHDPNGVWERGKINLEIVVTYSDDLAKKRGRKTKELKLTLAPGRGLFAYDSGHGDDRLEVWIDAAMTIQKLAGHQEIPDDERERQRIRPPEFYRDYYGYLYGMPMKLRDPGARLDPKVGRTTFEGRNAFTLRVTYDPEVGSDIWTFFFDPETYAIIGYRFQKDEEGTVGETIVLGGEIHDEASGFRIPKTQAWYVLVDGEYLATDEITAMTVRLP